jgi:hypothetical protein
MDAFTRQQYLQALGIQHWVPRYQLPGAPHSAQCELPDGAFIVGRQDAKTESAVGHPSNLQSSGAVEKPVSGSRIDIDFGAHTGSPGQVSPKKPVSVSSAVGIRFNLALVSSGNGLLLALELPDGANEITVPIRQFAQELLFALGFLRDQPCKADLFSWPMIATQQVDQSETAAREALQASLHNYENQAPLQTVIALGELPAHYLLEEKLSLEQLRLQEHAIKGSSAVLVATHGIQDLFNSPELKKQVWADLSRIKLN